LDKDWEEALHVLLAALLGPSLSLFLVGEFQSSLSREDQGVPLQGNRHVEAVEGVSVNLLQLLGMLLEEDDYVRRTRGRIP